MNTVDLTYFIYSLYVFWSFKIALSDKMYIFEKFLNVSK